MSACDSATKMSKKISRHEINKQEAISRYVRIRCRASSTSSTAGTLKFSPVISISSNGEPLRITWDGGPIKFWTNWKCLIRLHKLI